MIDGDFNTVKNAWFFVYFTFSPSDIVNTTDYHSIWLAADQMINRHQLFPKDDKHVDLTLNALATAKIVSVDVLGT